MEAKKECAAGDEGAEVAAGPTEEVASPAEVAAPVEEIVSETVTPGTETEPPTDDSGPGTDTEVEKEIDENITISEKAPEGPEKVFCEHLLDNLNKFLTSQYAFDILKCTLVFILAIKLANDCSNIALPLKYYRPFH